MSNVSDSPEFAEDIGLYRSLLDGAPDAILAVNREGRIVVLNQRAEQLFGYSRSELLGQSVDRLVPARCRAGHMGLRDRYVENPSPRPMGSGRDLYAVHRDGTEIPVEISLSPVPGRELVCASIRHIGERKRIEAGLRNLAAVVDSSADAILSRDLEGRIVSWNRGAERLYGYRTDEIFGRPIDSLIPPHSRSEEEGLQARVLRGEIVQHIETQRVRKDGRLIDVSVTISPVLDGNGTIVGTSKVARDITDRKRLELAAQRLQAHLLSAIESIPGSFAIFDADERLVICNSECRLRYGKSEAAMIGTSIGDLVRFNIERGVFALGGRTETAYLERWLDYYRAPFGSLDLELAGGAVARVNARKTSEGGTVVTLLDVTEDLGRELELRRAYAAAEAASLAKSEFLASMSHELRTPLNSILGFAQLLARDKKSPLSERHLERVHHVLKAGEHLLRLIDDVLDLAKIEAGRVTMSPEPVSLPQVLDEIQVTLTPMAARAGTSLLIDALEPDIPEVIADRVRLKQILMNLGSNAIKYGRADGTVRFAVSRRGERVRVSVIDDGIGIPPEKQSKIFEPFQRAGQESGPIEGTGIGLTITKRLAEQMEAIVGFDSTYGSGSTFWIELTTRITPKDESTFPRIELNPTNRLSDPEGPHFLVVYVEDNPSNIAFMEDLLSDYGCVELVTAPTAEIGLELVRSNRPQLVLMDINLPGMSGVEAVRLLRSWPETSEIPVVALSAAAMPREKDALSQAGFYRYLSKPVDVDELALTLEEILAPPRVHPPRS